MINKLQSIAEDRGIFCKHIEIEERNDFISQIAECSQSFLRKVSTKEKFRHLVQKPLEAIKYAGVLLIREKIYFFIHAGQRFISFKYLMQSLTDVFTTIGETAQKTETPICFLLMKFSI